MLIPALLMLLALFPLPPSPQTDSATASPLPRQSLIVVLGAEGDEQYGPQFLQAATRWLDLGKTAQVDCVAIGTEEPGEVQDLARLETALADQPKEHPEPLWIVLIGHGTFDGRQARFNLRGSDLTADQLAEWLKPFQRTVVIVNCASASSPFMSLLAGENRMIITVHQERLPVQFRAVRSVPGANHRRRAGRSGQGRSGLTAGGLPAGLIPSRRVLSTGSPTGHRTGVTG